MKFVIGDSATNPEQRRQDIGHFAPPGRGTIISVADIDNA